MFPILVVILLAFIMAAVFTKGQPKSPATSEQIFAALENNGFQGFDLTTDYRENGILITSLIFILAAKLMIYASTILALIMIRLRSLLENNIKATLEKVDMPIQILRLRKALQIICYIL